MTSNIKVRSAAAYIPGMTKTENPSVGTQGGFTLTLTVAWRFGKNASAAVVPITPDPPRSKGRLTAWRARIVRAMRDIILFGGCVAAAGTATAKLAEWMSAVSSLFDA